jgi:hypothetical protein
MSLKTAQAKANREKPAKGQHRFTWSQPYGSATSGNYSQTGRCSCGAEVHVNNFSRDVWTTKKHREPDQHPPRYGYYLPDTGRQGANIASALMFLRESKLGHVLNEEDGHRYTLPELEKAMDGQTIYQMRKP